AYQLQLPVSGVPQTSCQTHPETVRPMVLQQPSPAATQAQVAQSPGAPAAAASVGANVASAPISSNSVVPTPQPTPTPCSSVAAAPRTAPQPEPYREYSGYTAPTGHLPGAGVADRTDGESETQPIAENRPVSRSRRQIPVQEVSQEPQPPAVAEAPSAATRLQEQAPRARSVRTSPVASATPGHAPLHLP